MMQIRLAHHTFVGSGNVMLNRPHVGIVVELPVKIAHMLWSYEMSLSDTDYTENIHECSKIVRHNFENNSIEILLAI